ncbi:exonuclease SbcCD subunit D [Methanosarcinales archaeon]|nr:MAG: exonuclease SbcCD subunit D [Methanosarcinales archaeon]
MGCCCFSPIRFNIFFLLCSSMDLNFIHGSDFHLGYVQYNLHERFLDLAHTFKAFIEYGLEHDVDFILIAGDLFEKRNINAPTYLQAYRVLSWLQGECKSRGREPIPVIVIEGNHDLAYHRDRNSWLQILDSQGLLRLLKSSHIDGLRLDYVDVGGCRIFGVEYLGAFILQSIPLIGEEIDKINNDSDRFTILMMHFGMEGRARSEIAGEIPYNTLLQLRECVDYLALGHYHTRYEYDGWVYNGGSPETLSLNEYGIEKGFYHVAGEGARFVELTTRPFKHLSCQISSIKTPHELSLLLRSMVESEAPINSKLSPIVELTLWGNLNFPKKDIPTSDLKKIIADRFNPLHTDVHVKYSSDPYLPNIRGMSREAIETKILTEQVLQDGRYRSHVKQVVRDVLWAKKLALQRAGEDEITRRLKESFEEMEAEDKGHKNGEIEKLSFVKGDPG